MEMDQIRQIKEDCKNGARWLVAYDRPEAIHQCERLYHLVLTGQATYEDHELWVNLDYYIWGGQ